jgi:hypothetical protein
MKPVGERTRITLPLAMPLVVEKTMVIWVLVTPGKGRAMVRLVVAFLPVPVVESEFERAFSPMDKWREELCRSMLKTVVPVNVRAG